MTRYITSNPQQLFDAGEWIHTVSETAQDVEHLYNVLSPDDVATATTRPIVRLPSGMPDERANDPGQQANVGIAPNLPIPDKATDYTPYLVAGGALALVVTIWWLSHKK